MTSQPVEARAVEAELTVPTCDAFLREQRLSPTGWGTELVQCRSTRGLSAFRDYQGQTRRACGAQGHAANCVRRFGVLEDPPDWANLGPMR